MKPETEIRNLKRELKDATARVRRLEGEAFASMRRVKTAELEASEWKRRFDALLELLELVEERDHLTERLKASG